MPTTDNQGSFLNLISIRRNQVTNIEPEHNQDQEDLELFQKHVSSRFSDLLNNSNSSAAETSSDAPPPPPPPPLLSISWLRNLLDVFLCCEAEFKAILISGRDPSQLSKPPLDRLLPDLLDRLIKALDVCNAVTHGVDLLRHWQKLSHIAVASLQQQPLGEGQVRRARKALATILTSMALDDKEQHSSSNSFHARHLSSAAARRPRDSHFRSLSWSVAKSWSAAKQTHAMSASLVAPRGAEVTGLPMPMYIMSNVLVFVMWALVAAIPCQERAGLATHLQMPKQLSWAQAMSGLVEKIGEDWKKKDKKGSAGLLEEVQRLERVAQWLVDLADSFMFPLDDDKAAELAAQVAELAEISAKMEEGLVPLQQQIREVFHKMVRSRADVLDVLDQPGGKSSIPVPY